MPTTSPRSRRTTDEFTSWLEEAAKSAYARARADQASAQDAADISQEVVEYALRYGRSIVAVYPNPHIFAAVRTFHAGIAWARRNATQSGQGSGFGRSQQSLDIEFEDGTCLGDSIVSDFDTVETAERRLLSDAVRLVVGTTLDSRTARWVWDVKGDGLSVAEVARRDGVARETVSRAVNGAVRQLQVALGDFIGG